MKVIIVGGGEPLYFLCRSFIAKGFAVTIINRSPEECVQLSRQLKAMVICGDASNAEVLQEAGAMEADALLAITPKDQDNLIICQLASVQYGVSRVVALANDPDNAVFFEKLGVSSFSTTRIISSLIEEKASLEQIINLLPIGEGLVNITEIMLDQESPVSGKLLKEIELPENVLVAVVIRDNHPIIPRGANRLLPGDRVVLITMPENHGQALKVFSGEQ